MSIMSYTFLLVPSAFPQKISLLSACMQMHALREKLNQRNIFLIIYIINLNDNGNKVNRHNKRLKKTIVCTISDNMKQIQYMQTPEQL